MKDSINLIKKGLNEIHKFDNKLLLISLISVVSNVCSIMINIFFSSYMISLLENGSLKQILINLLILSIANSLFLLIQKTFEQILDGRKTILLNKERLKINKIFSQLNIKNLKIKNSNHYNKNTSKISDVPEAHYTDCVVNLQTL